MKTTASILAGALIAAGIMMPTEAAEASTAPVVKLSDYASAASSDALPGVHKAMKAVEAQGGGTILVDGMFKIRNFINLDTIKRDANIQFVGTSTSSSGFTGTTNAPIFFQGDNTLRPEAKGNQSSPYRGQYRYNTVFKNLKLVKPQGTIGRIFDFRTGAQVNMRMENLDIDSYATGANNEAIAFSNNVQAHGNVFRSLRIQLRPVNTSGGVKVNTFHNGFNNNAFENITLYKFNNNGAPGFELKPITGQFTNNAFRSITGQNLAGGFIHVYGQNGGGVYDSSNWDSPAGTVFRDSIRIGKTSQSWASRGFVLSGLGNVEQTLGQKALMSGRHLIAVSPSTTNLSIIGTNAKATNTGLTY